MQLSSAEATSLNQPIAAALAALLAQQQQGGGLPGPIGLPTPQSGRALGPDEQQALLLSAAAAAAAATGQLPSPRLPPGMPGLPPRAVQPAAVLPGGTLTTLQQTPQQPPFGSTAPSAADLARLGSGSAADLARLNSGGVGQKNLTIDDLKVSWARVASWADAGADDAVGTRMAGRQGVLHAAEWRVSRYCHSPWPHRVCCRSRTLGMA